MRMEVKSVQVPRWLAPLMALVLIPLTLMMAVGIAVLAVGATVVKVFLPSSSRSSAIPSRTVKFPDTNRSAIDAEYEIKDEK